MHIFGFYLSRVQPRHVEQFELLRGIYERITTMSINLDNLRAALSKLGTDLAASQAETKAAIAALQAKLDAGDSTTQADIDAITNSVTAMDATIAAVPVVPAPAPDAG